ncbi:HK97 family phage prohead protease [Cyclobacterium plantarum]|uniref:HK97 family phage prohead protease n=1 Tax=Cyclobacterium plantarum TaxID=2716263 RepID=A0ABX0HBY1_9BACT|nr:HK97 family phage prohead protease [Cyclobacterium plantarum]NHE57962.1 HK97 family phage prohead protease [Cyclobacterium plantarum]
MKEIRTFSNIEFRTLEENESKYIQGYALKFDTLSKDLGGFYETINRQAINDTTDLSDVVALFNHNPLYVLARKSNDVDTLELKVDDTGLYYKFEIDEEISYHKDLFRNIQKGNISKSSFAFKVNDNGESWEKRDDKYIRTITSFKGIYDVSPVTNPAYEDTSVRNFEDVIKQLDKREFDYSHLAKYYLLKNSLV